VSVIFTAETAAVPELAEGELDQKNALHDGILIAFEKAYLAFVRDKDSTDSNRGTVLSDATEKA